MTGSVFLSGGGGAEDSAPLDSAFAAALGSGPLWYWPVAMDPVAMDPVTTDPVTTDLAEQAYADCLAWLTGVFGPLGVTDIDMWEGSGTGLAERLPDYRGVYIGGGNTFRLLDLVRRNGLLPPLRDFIENGGVVYGGSAGAALLGSDISTIAHMDPDPYGTTDTRGLDRIAGYGVFVHHRPSEVPRAQDWARENHRPVVALHERAGAVVTDGRLTSVGFEPVEIIDTGTLGVRSVRPGESVAL